MKICKIKSIKHLGMQKTYNLTMASEQHNYAICGTTPSKFVISRNSHAVAYMYISARLLYLKSHYPLEFYASILKCENVSDKIKDYKIEAKNHNIEIRPLDLNNSKEGFGLVDDNLYFGFSNVKGIGTEPAKRIVEGQPYSGFEDFLKRFGTDASVLKCLIGLRCFKEADPVVLWKYLEFFKEYKKKIVDKENRFKNNFDKSEELYGFFTSNSETIKFSDLTGDDPFSDVYWQQYDTEIEIEIEKETECDADEGEYSKVVIKNIKVDESGLIIEEERLKYFKKIKVKKKLNRLNELKKLWSKRQQNFEKYKNVFNIPSFESFNPEKQTIDKNIQSELEDLFGCEKKYYGFSWTSKLSNSSMGKTFSLRKENKIGNGYVEFEIVDVKKYKTKAGADYLQIKGQDFDGIEERINVWSEDVERWHQELKKGNLIRMKVTPPSKGFNTFSIESNRSKNYVKKNMIWTSKEEDPRVIILKGIY